MSFIATKPLLLADQFSNGSDLPDLTTIQEYKEALPRSKQRLISFHPIDPVSIIPDWNIIRFRFHFRWIFTDRRIFYAKKKMNESWNNTRDSKNKSNSRNNNR